METMTPTALLERLRWRYATKRFDTERKISADVWAALEQTLVLSPSSFGLQPWRFVVVHDPAVRERLVGASWGQRQIADASHLVVFAIKTGLGVADVDRYVQAVSETTGAPVDALAGMRKMIVGFLAQEGFDVDAWSARQLYIALGMFMESAAVLGVDTCPMEGIVPAQDDEILGLAAEGYRTYAACCAGYRHPEDKYGARKKVRYPAAEIVTHV